MQVRRVRVQIETVRQRIIGTLQLPTEGYRSRTTDFLNSFDTGFIPLTEVELTELPDGQTFGHPFAAVGARHVVAVAELEDLGVVEESAPQPPAVSMPPPAH